MNIQILTERAKTLPWTQILLLAILLSSLANGSKLDDIYTALGDVHSAITSAGSDAGTNSDEIKEKLDEVKTAVEENAP